MFDAVMAAERRRCEAIIAQRFDELLLLLAPDLVHIHTRGNTDTRDSYIRYLRETLEILDIQRADLQLHACAPTVVLMHGRQSNRARWRGALEEVIVDSVATQVWIRADGGWQLRSFHATALGPPRPVSV